MSKIVFSVLSVLLSFVMLFSFVRSAFGVGVVSSKEFVKGVAEISTDFSRTSKELQSLKAAYDGIEFPAWDEIDFTADTQDDLRRKNGNIFTLNPGTYKIEANGTLIAPNGARYTKYEYLVAKNGYATVSLGLFSSYSLFDEIMAKAKEAILKSDDGLLKEIVKGLLYANSFFDYLSDVITLLFELLFVVIALVKDTVFFVVDVLLFLLEMLGIDTAGKTPLTT